MPISLAVSHLLTSMGANGMHSVGQYLFSLFESCMIPENEYLKGSETAYAVLVNDETSYNWVYANELCSVITRFLLYFWKQLMNNFFCSSLCKDTKRNDCK